MGKKAKNATFISGSEANKILREIQKVEKKRIVKSTLCNERSSRSHCMIILDVPTVGGRLMLVDMAGSENIEQAGQSGFEAKMQTAKINQGNIALKRVVESIANGDSHVPFRDSKLTMLLQDSFEDDKSKILMILCASPDPKEIHKTICTLEYGAKAKCIVRGPHTPIKDSEESSAGMLGSRVAAMDQFIYKLQLENKLKEKERNEAHKQLMEKEEEIAALRRQIAVREAVAPSEEEINAKVNERTMMMKLELERKLEECQKAAEKCFEMEKRRMEEKILEQQQEVEMLRRRLQEVEMETSRPTRDKTAADDGCRSSFTSRLFGACGDDEAGMVKSMDLDMGDQEVFVREVKFVDTAANNGSPYFLQPQTDVFGTNYGDKFNLTTVFEEEEEDEEENEEQKVEEEVEKKVIEEMVDLKEDTSEASRRLRIQNIFTLCGNQRELTHTAAVSPKGFGVDCEKENNNPRHSEEEEEEEENKNPKPFPLSPLLDLENIIRTPGSCLSKQQKQGGGDAFSPELGHLSTTPFITQRKVLNK
ncbi:Kinesin-like protein KIN-10A [Linum grandiflorum]